MLSLSGTQSLLAQLTKKNQNSYSCQEKPYRQGQGQGQNTPTTGVNAITIRKNKDKTKKDLGNIEYYNYKQKGHYANKYPKKKTKN